MAVSGFFGRHNLSRIEVSVELPPEVYAQRPFPCRVSMKNGRKFFPAFLLRVEVEGQSVLFPFVETGADAARNLTLVCEQRGRHMLGDVYLASVFPFNFFIRYRKLKISSEWLVFPEPRKCGFVNSYERRLKAKGESSVNARGFEGDFLTIRDYLAGDPMKYISWKATARTGELKTRELSALTSRPVIIDLETLPIRNTEEKVSCVTYIILQLLNGNVPVGLKAGTRVFNPGLSTSHKLDMLGELALYGLVPRT